MYDNNPLPEVSEADRQLLAMFAQDAFPAVEATADDLVTVKMTSRFEVTHVKIKKTRSHGSDHTAIEHAVKTAVNKGIRMVADLNASRLSEFSAKS